jgi:hypothetical protein
MGRAADKLEGLRFGKLTVIRRATSNSTEHSRWLCRCDCGSLHESRASHLKQGNVSSCGCLPNIYPEASLRHGHARAKKRSGTYSSWAAMLSRCRNPKSSVWERYGGRGITVCERWLKYENFLADMGERPIKGTIERKDNDGNYEPGNCLWITQAEQLLNTRRTKYVEWNGETKPLHQWCKLLGLDLERTRSRLKYAPPARVFASTEAI